MPGPYTQDAAEHVRATAPAETDNELKEKAVMGSNITQEPALSAYTATGYLSRDEVDILRNIHSFYTNLKTFENRAGMEFDDVRANLRQKLMFLPHSGKNIHATGLKQINTQHIKQDEQIDHRQTRDDGKGRGFLDRLFGGAKQARQADVPDVLGEQPEPMHFDRQRDRDFIDRDRRGGQPPIW